MKEIIFIGGGGHCKSIIDDIEHDCLISKHCHISMNTTSNGGVTVESRCLVDSNATTKELITISENSFIKAGSLVT